MFNRIANGAEISKTDELSAMPLPNAEDAISRPKFSRRPASFAIAPTGEKAEQHLPRGFAPSMPPSKMPAAIMTTVAWQEDIRFGIVLVLLLLVLNIMLGMAMPLLPALQVGNDSNESIAAMGQMPQAVRGHVSVASPVTFYAQPAEKKSPEDSPDEDAAPENLSTSVDDFPAPIAKPLDSDKSLPPNEAGHAVDAQ